MKVCLSARGLGRLSNTHQNDFTFIVDGREFSCPSFIAEFLSPKIAKLRSVDSTFCCYSVNVKDQSSDFGFRRILELCGGSELNVEAQEDQANCVREYFLNIACELENDELYDAICDQVELSAENVISRAERRRERADDVDRELGFIFEHFEEMSNEIFSRFDFSTLSMILQDERLKIPDEDWLFEQICRETEHDAAKVQLFEFIYFEMLNVGSMMKFVEFCRDHFEFLNLCVFDRICGRLIHQVADTKSMSDRRTELNFRYKYRGKTFAFSESAPFNGIFSYLTSKHGGNVHDKGIVSVTQSSTYSNLYAKNCVDLNSDSYSETESQPNQWISFDFKEMKVRVTNYSIRAAHVQGCSNPKSWVIEVCDDGKSWEEVDRQGENQYLNGENFSHTFNISNPRFCRFLRLRQISSHQSGSGFLVLRHFELFGSLRE